MRRSDREAAMKKHREEAGPKRMRVHTSWTPEARSRTGSRTKLPTTPRETRSSRRRNTSPTGHRNIECCESDTPLHKARRKTRDELLVETKR